MKKFLISESEKTQILNQHKDYKEILKKLSVKKSISEQIQPPTGDELLTKAMKVCGGLTAGKMRRLKAGGNAVVVTAAKDGPASSQTGQPRYVTGDLLVYKSDMTYDVYDNLNNKKGTYRWKCSNLNKEADTEKERRMTEFKNTHDGGGWMTEKEAVNSGKIVSTDDTTYDTVAFDGVTLYRPKATGGKKAFTPTQQEYINRMKNEGWVEEGDPVLTGPDKDNFYSAIAPGSEKVFPPSGIKMFKSRKEIVKSSEQTIKNAEEAVRSKTFDRGNCKDFIDLYWKSFKLEGDQPNQQPNENLKISTQACIRQFYKNWGGLFSGARKYDAIIDSLTMNMEYEGYQGPVYNSPWKLNPKR